MQNKNYLSVIEVDLRAEYAAGVRPTWNPDPNSKTVRTGTGMEAKLAREFGGKADDYIHIVAVNRFWAHQRFQSQDQLASAKKVADESARLKLWEKGPQGKSVKPALLNEEQVRDKIASQEQFLADLNVYLEERSRKKIAQLLDFIDSIPDESPWEAEERRRANEEQFRETCRHEALHAAAVMDRGGRVTELVVNRSNNTGHCLYTDLPAQWQPVVDVAGSLAHQRGRGLYEPGCESDREHFVAGVDAKLPPDFSARDRDYAIGARMIDAEKHADAIWDQRGVFVKHLMDWLFRKHRLNEREIKELWDECEGSRARGW